MATPSLYKMIVEPLRNELLERFFDRPEYWRDQLAAKIIEVPTYIDPRTCPDEFLIYLKDLVGWTDDVGITSDLSDRDLRKIITLAIPIWKQKGTEFGIVNLARLLTAKNVIFGSWFYFRWILGETGLWEEQAGSDPWILGGEVTSYDEFWSNLRVMDSPELDHDLLEDVIAIERPTNERIEIVYLGMLDWFNEDLRYWTSQVVGKEAILDDVNHRMVIPGTGREQITVPWITSWQYFVSLASARRPVDTSADSYRVRFYVQDVDNCYIVEIKTDSTLNLIERVSGGEIIKASSTGSFGASQYKLRIETIDGVPGATYITIRVYLDADLEIEWEVKKSALAFSSGAIEIENPNATNNIETDNVEVWEKPLEYVLIGP
jgi:phage tail-like protein